MMIFPLLQGLGNSQRLYLKWINRICNIYDITWKINFLRRPSKSITNCLDKTERLSFLGGLIIPTYVYSVLVFRQPFMPFRTPQIDRSGLDVNVTKRKKNNHHWDLTIHRSRIILLWPIVPRLIKPSKAIVILPALHCSPASFLAPEWNPPPYSRGHFVTVSLAAVTRHWA